MAGDDQDKKSSFVVLYLLTVLLGLTLAVTIYVFARPEELFPVYRSPRGATGAGSANHHGYNDVRETSTGRTSVRYETVPLNGDLTITPGKSGGYDLTLTVTDTHGRPYVPHSYSVRVFRHGGDEKDGFTPIFANPSPGVYTSHIAFPAPGDWAIHVQMHYESAEDTVQKILGFTKIQTVK
jgi:hypothetical protein